MNKKYLSSLALLSCVCGCLVACNNETKKADLFYAYSTENLLSDWDYLHFDPNDSLAADESKNIVGRDYTLRYNLTKGENEGMQLMIAANKYIANFDFELPTLTGPNGATIGKENFTVDAVWYTQVYGSLELTAFPGLYPDALIPLERYKVRHLNHIDKGRNQSLYINLKSTTEMTAGTYRGNGKLTLDGEVTEIPFEVTIYDFEMPEEVHWTSSYLVWYEEIIKGEGTSSPELEKAYYDYIVAHRMSPDGFPDYMENTPELFADYYYELVANNPKVSSYRVPATTNFTYNLAKAYLQALINKNLELRRSGDTTTDLFKKLYFYAIDEPSITAYEQVRYIDSTIYNLKNELKGQLEAYPELVESFTHIKNLVTIPYSTTLEATNTQGGVECWCPQYQHFDSQADRDTYRERQTGLTKTGEEVARREYGENVWWYGCMDPRTPYPSLHLDAKLILSRVVPYMQFDYHVEGNLYWNVCYYSKYTNSGTFPRDIWGDPMTWLKCAGDGALVYPGHDFGLNHPISTLRLESIQAGAEDYEYSYLIDQKVNEYNQLNGTNYDSRALLQKYYTQLFVDVRPYNDSNVFNSVRNELLKVCEKLHKNLNDGMAELLK